MSDHQETKMPSKPNRSKFRGFVLVVIAIALTATLHGVVSVEMKQPAGWLWATTGSMFTFSLLLAAVLITLQFGKAEATEMFSRRLPFLMAWYGAMIAIAYFATYARGEILKTVVATFGFAVLGGISGYIYRSLWTEAKTADIDHPRDTA